MTVRRFSLTAFACMILLTAASVILTFAALQTQRQNALVINMAGRQRMLIQKMTLEAWGAQAGGDPRYAAELRETESVYFEQTLDALINGGEVTYDSGTTVTLPATRDPEILARLENVRSAWNEMNPAIHTILSSPPGSPEMNEAVDSVTRLSPVLLARMDEVVRMYEVKAARDAERVQTIQVGFLGMAAALILAVLIGTDRGAINPLARLGVSVQRIGEGDLETPVSVSGLAEIAQLGRRFEEMRRNLASARFEGTRLYEQARERLERISALHDIDVAIISFRSMGERLVVLLEKVTERLRVDAAAVVLVEHETGKLTYAARLGLNGEFFDDGLLTLHGSVAGQAASAGKTIIVPDVSRDPRFARRSIAKKLGIVSYIAVPMRSHDRVIGVLELATRAPHEFLPEEVDFFVTLAGQAAIAIENARLFDNLAAEQLRVTILHRLSMELSATLDPERVATRALQAAAGALEISRGNILMMEEDNFHLRLLAVTGYDRETVEQINQRLRWDINQGVSGRVIRERKPVIVPDVTRNADWVSIPGLDEWVKSMVSIPLVAGDAVVGVFNLLSEETGFFEARDLSLLVSIASPVALALQNARLFDALRRQLDELVALHAVAAACAEAADEDALIENVTRIVGRTHYADDFGALLMDESSGALHFHPSYRGKWSDESFKDSIIPSGQGVIGQAAQTGQPRLVPDTANEPAYLDVGLAAPMRSELCVPLQTRGRVLGVINAESKRLNAFGQNDLRLLSTFAGQIAIALDRVRAESALHKSEERFRRLAENAQDIIYRYRSDSGRGFEYISPAVEAITGYSADEFYADPDLHLKIVHPEDRLQMEATFREEGVPGRPVLLRWVRKDGAIVWLEHRNVVIRNEARQPVAIEGIGRDVTERRRSEEETRLLQTVTLAISETEDLRDALAMTLRLVCDTTGWTMGEAWIPNTDETFIEFSHAWHSSIPNLEPFREVSAIFAFPPGVGLPGRVWASGKPVWIRDVTRDPNFPRGSAARDFGLKAAMGIPVKTGSEIVAVMDFFQFELRDEDERLIALVSSVAAQLGAVIQRKQAEAALRRRAGELEALAVVSSTLREAKNLEEMRPIILGSVLQVMGAQAGVFLLFDKDLQELYVAVSQGFSDQAKQVRIKIGEGLAGQCAQTGQPILTDNISADPRMVNREAARGFHKALCHPLKSLAGLEGVLLICFTARGMPSPDETSLLTAIAEMAGNALYRMSLYGQTLRDAISLTQAYDATIEGWSRALDLRDHETEGHTQRVTELALGLARAVGIGGFEIEHFRRGALLHDIGKMAIPDRILHKPGALDDGEMAWMRQHPQFAFDMLFPIEYLQPALEIPYCHHEKWNGAGYPRGLKGEEIPLAARVFAVADVFDALTSDRPYRRAWTKKKAVAYIRGQAGRHFDPRIVDLFLKMIQGGK